MSEHCVTCTADVGGLATVTTLQGPVTGVPPAPPLAPPVLLELPPLPSPPLPALLALPPLEAPAEPAAEGSAPSSSEPQAATSSVVDDMMTATATVRATLANAGDEAGPHAANFSGRTKVMGSLQRGSTLSEGEPGRKTEEGPHADHVGGGGEEDAGGRGRIGA